MKVGYNLEKNVGIKFSKYKGDAIRLLTQIPYTVDEVILSVKGNPQLKRKITTFRNSKGEMIERSFNYYDRPLRNRTYNKQTTFVSDSEYVTSTEIKEYLLDRKYIKPYRVISENSDTKLKKIMWQNRGNITNHFSENVDTLEQVLSQVKIEKDGLFDFKRHTFIEFPHIKDRKIEKGSKKSLTFLVNFKKDKLKKSSLKADGVEAPVNDSFLPYRALSIEDAKVPLVQRYLKKNGIQYAGIHVNPRYNPINEKHTGYKAKFDPNDGVVKFNQDYKFKSKSELANTSSHESLHGYQFFLHARNTGGSTDWEETISKRYGSIYNKKLRAEAEEYTESIENYIPFYENLEKYKKENLIEKKAFEEGAREEAKYDKEGEVIRADFPYIPKEFL